MQVRALDQPKQEQVDVIQRLKSLLPNEIRHRVVVTQTLEPNLPLIHARREDSDRFVIEINKLDWPNLVQAEQDLLFWHYASCIRNNTIFSTKFEMNLIKGGLLLSLVELMSQNLLVFAISAVMIGFATHQLYQNNQGEQALKSATAADQDSINLALEYGYSFNTAYSALKNALKYLSAHAKNSRERNRYKARLNVLNICARVHDLDVQNSSQTI